LLRIRLIIADVPVITIELDSQDLVAIQTDDAASAEAALFKVHHAVSNRNQLALDTTAIAQYERIRS
jgi:hypothetical protein